MNKETKNNEMSVIPIGTIGEIYDLLQDAVASNKEDVLLGVDTSNGALMVANVEQKCLPEESNSNCESHIIPNDDTIILNDAFEDNYVFSQKLLGALDDISDRKFNIISSAIKRCMDMDKITIYNTVKSMLDYGSIENHFWSQLHK